MRYPSAAWRAADSHTSLLGRGERHKVGSAIKLITYCKFVTDRGQGLCNIIRESGGSRVSLGLARAHDIAARP